MFQSHFPEISLNHLGQYIHDVIIFDQEKSLAKFYQDSLELKKLYQGEDLAIALRTLAKTFWIKDEVFVSHLMISPVKLAEDKKRYAELGSSFEIVHINRPAFDVGSKKIEFDFSPKPWMLKIMRHLRILRTLMPEWHKKEKQLAQDIRSQLLTSKLSKIQLKRLDSVKGYRDVRYKSAKDMGVGHV